MRLCNHEKYLNRFKIQYLSEYLKCFFYVSNPSFSAFVVVKSRTRISSTKTD